jgi:hypothetical protein
MNKAVKGFMAAVGSGAGAILAVVLIDELVDRAALAGNSESPFKVLFQAIILLCGYCFAVWSTRKNIETATLSKTLLLTLLWYVTGLILVGIFVPVH